jgi:hypothetical protein
MTMTLIESKTLATAAAVIEFTSIPQDGTDLYVLASARSAESTIGNALLVIRPNGASTNGSGRMLFGNGSSAQSIALSNIDGGWITAVASTSNTFSNNAIYITNYTSSTNKSFSADGVQETNATLNYIGISSSLWTNTAAITSLEFRTLSATNLVAGTTISLYKITKGSDGIVTTSP